MYINITCYLLYCTNDRFQQTGEISHFIKALRLRQLRVKLISWLSKSPAIPFSQVSADSFRFNIQECSRSLYAFIAFRPTCFARCLVMQNLHETSTQHARQLYPDSKNNSRRITYANRVRMGDAFSVPFILSCYKRIVLRLHFATTVKWLKNLGLSLNRQFQIMKIHT